MTCFTYFEPLTAGHCAYWARMVLPAAHADPRVSRLRLITGAEMADRLAPEISATGLDLEILDETALSDLNQPSLMARGRAQWRMAAEQLTKAPGRLFLPFFDHAIYGAVLDRKPVTGQISGIVFRPPNHYNHDMTLHRRLDSLRRWGTYMAARRPASPHIFTLDECAAETGLARRLGLLHHLPDPAPDLSLLDGRSRSRAEDGRRRFLLFGALTERKGIFAVLDAVMHLSPEQRARTALRFVGRVDAADRSAFIARFEQVRTACPEAEIMLLDDFVSDPQLAQEVTDCDVVLAPYQNHVGSSGVVFWAAAANKPLVSQRTGLMGYQVDRYDLGLTADTTDPVALAAAFDQVRQKPHNAAFLRKHCAEAFTGTILTGCLS